MKIMLVNTTTCFNCWRCISKSFEG